MGLCQSNPSARSPGPAPTASEPVRRQPLSENSTSSPYPPPDAADAASISTPPKEYSKSNPKPARGISSRPTSSDIATTLTSASRPSRKASTYSLVHAAALSQLYTPSPTNPKQLPQGVKGCPNLGNTCYFNATAQALFATPPLVDYFLGYDYRGELNPGNDQGSKKAQVARAFGEAVRSLWGERTGGGATDVRALHGSLVGFHREFGDMGQHDVAESLGFLLDAVHEDLNRVEGKKP
jgi:ubiquitin C-terminal hydrolase